MGAKYLYDVRYELIARINDESWILLTESRIPYPLPCESFPTDTLRLSKIRVQKMDEDHVPIGEPYWVQYPTEMQSLAELVKEASQDAVDH